jgi:hypothetical protein
MTGVDGGAQEGTGISSAINKSIGHFPTRRCKFGM